MRKTELIEEIVKITGLTKKDATKTVDAVFATIASKLKEGEEVTINDFGKFSRVAREARTYKAFGKETVVAAHNAPVFTAAKALKEAVK